MPTTIHYLTLLGSFTAALMLWPQTVKVWRAGTVEGVAPTTWMLQLVSVVSWGVYSYVESIFPLMLANVSCAAAVLGVVGYGIWKGWRWTVLLYPVLILGAFLGFAIWFPPAVHWGLLATSILLPLPQLVAVFRSSHLAGVSLLTWGIAGAQSVLWVVVFYAEKSYAGLAATLVGVLTNATIVIVGYRKSSR